MPLWSHNRYIRSKIQCPLLETIFCLVCTFQVNLPCVILYLFCFVTLLCTYRFTLRPLQEYGIDYLVVLGGSVEGVIVATVPDDPPRLASVNLKRGHYY